MLGLIMDDNSIPPVPPLSVVYGAFTGEISQANLPRIVLGLGNLIQGGTVSAHFAFQTFGGFVGDGIFLYNLFRQIPLDLTIYNIGNVSSIGVIAFLGVTKRKATSNATFLIHRTTGAANQSSALQLESRAKGTFIDDQRTEAILRERARLTDEHWAIIDRTDLTLTAAEALDVGLIDEITDFVPVGNFFAI